jgi:hypothetical protein
MKVATNRFLGALVRSLQNGAPELNKIAREGAGKWPVAKVKYGKRAKPGPPLPCQCHPNHGVV